MLKRVLTFSVFAVLIFGLVSVAGAQDATEEPSESESALQIDQVPAWIRATAEQVAEQYFSSATFDRVQFDAEGEPPYAYEFAGTAEDGTAFEIDVLADGMLSEIEEVIEASEVPETANSLFQAYFADLQVELIERSTRPLANGVMGIWYEYDGIGADGRELDVEVNEDGTMMVVEIGG